MTYTSSVTPSVSGQGSPTSLLDEREALFVVRVRRVVEASKKEVDEFNASRPLVVTALSAEVIGVTRNAMSIALSVIRPSGAALTPAIVGVAVATGALFIIQGFTMLVIGAILLPTAFADFQKALEGNSADEKLRSGLNLCSKLMLTGLGALFIAIGSLQVALVAAPLAAGFALTLIILSFILAGVVTVRSVEMMVRGGVGLWKTNQFQKQFLSQHQRSEKLALEWLMREMKDPAALKNRIGSKAFDELNQYNQYSPTGLTPVYTPENVLQLVNVLQLIDEGICEQKLKQQLILSIGVVMFVGGVISLAGLSIAPVVAAPIALAVDAAGCALSLGMEALWMPYDNPAWFNKLHAWRYRMHVRVHPNRFASDPLSPRIA